MKPSAEGTLGATPLAHALVYARHRRLTGWLELTSGDQAATIVLAKGSISSVTTRPVEVCSGAYFGAIAYELGLVDASALNASLLEIATTKRQHGEILVATGKITEAQRDQVLVEQIHRKVQHLFTLPDTTTYAFYDSPAAPATTVAVDPIGPAWRGIAEHAPEAFVRETMRRVGGCALRATSSLPDLPPEERKLLAALAEPRTVDELAALTTMQRARVERLVYLLVIAKCVVSVTGERTHPSVGALPATVASGAFARVAPSSSQIPVAAPSGPTAPPLDRDTIVARAAAVHETSFFDLLGVRKDATDDAVRAAYLRLARVWHPDKLPPELHGVRAEAAKVFASMAEAYRTLSDPQLRRAYLEANGSPKPRTRADLLRAAEHALETQKFELATILAGELCERDEGDADALAVRTWATVRGGDADEEELRAALTQLHRAVNTDDTSVRALFYRGLAQKRLGNTGAAARDFARAAVLDADHVGAARELRLHALRAQKGSGEHRLVAPLVEKLERARRK